MTQHATLDRSIQVPESEQDVLRIAMQQARDEGETWFKIAARCLVPHPHLIFWMRREKALGVNACFRIANAFGYDLTIVANKRPAIEGKE